MSKIGTVVHTIPEGVARELIADRFTEEEGARHGMQLLAEQSLASLRQAWKTIEETLDAAGIKLDHEKRLYRYDKKTGEVKDVGPVQPVVRMTKYDFEDPPGGQD